TQVYDVRISELTGDAIRHVLLGARIPAAGAPPAPCGPLGPPAPEPVVTNTERRAPPPRGPPLRPARPERARPHGAGRATARTSGPPDRADAPTRRDGVAGGEPSTTATGPASPDVQVEDMTAELVGRDDPELLILHRAAHEALEAREAAHGRASQLTLARLV